MSEVVEGADLGWQLGELVVVKPQFLKTAESFNFFGEPVQVAVGKRKVGEIRQGLKKTHHLLHALLRLPSKVNSREANRCDGFLAVWRRDNAQWGLGRNPDTLLRS